MAVLKYYALVVCICSANYCLAQATVKGSVTDNRKHPLADASIYIKGTATAATTDSSGHFVFTLNAKGVQAIVVFKIWHEIKKAVTASIRITAAMHCTMKW